MKVCAIIAEYNPFHTGHLYQIEKTKKFCDAIVVILSGHITQRGEFSIFNKWTKTKMALIMGANLVLELPTAFCCSSAEQFANSAMKIIKETQFITDICFGSEHGKIEKIFETAKICQTIDKTQKMQFFLKKGYSYPKARELAIGKNKEILTKPNNILAVEYVKAALNLNLKINFHTIKRIGANHNSKKTNLTASSSFLRSNIKNFKKIEKFIPEKIINLYKNPILIPEKLILNSLRLTTKEEFEKFPDTTEGLYNRIFKISKQATSLEEFFKLTKSKRYTMSRLKRIAIHSLLKTEKEKLTKIPQYSLILGFDSIGRKLIPFLKSKNFLFTTQFKEIYANFPHSAKLDCTATDIALLFETPPKPCRMNFKTKPIII